MSKLSMVAVLAVGLAVWAVLSNRSLAGSKVVLGKRHAASERLPLGRIDHTLWDQLLAKYVDEEGYVDYRSWHASREDLQRLDAYLAHLSQGNPQAQPSRPATLAFWINAYNAVTIKGILREYPTSSIRNHTAIVGYNIWQDLLLAVGDQQFSLDQMEHEILRPLGEPRIHFAIVCASIGCPRLLNQAFRPDQLEDQLTINTRNFFASRSKFRYDESTLFLSPVLKWFGSDFGATQAAQTLAIAPYLPDETAQQLAASGAATIRYLDYDWSLNDQFTRK